ncbi:MAG: ribonuclease [Thermoleophilia bacterium]|nr:ribonuclease [Thermoleophilia bacterium]
MSSVRAACRDVARGLVHDHGFHYAAGTAFRATLAMFPLMLGVLSLLSLLDAGDRAGEVLGTLAKTDAVPGKAVEALRDQLDNLQEPGPSLVLAAAAAFALALWSGAAGFRTIMSALNRALELEEHRGLMHRFGVSVGLATLTATLAIAASLLVALGPAIGELIRDAPGGSSGVFLAWRIIKWPLVIVCVFTWLATTYAWGPADRQRFRLLTPGILAAFVGWAAFALGFSWYVDTWGNQGRIYGAFAGLVVFQLYVYWSALIVLIGAEVDCVLERRGGRRDGEDSSAH